MHHLNGDRTESVFENIIPLQWELHYQLRRGRDRIRTKDCPGELHPNDLLKRAGVIYGTGNVVRAFGCARLAHATRRHFLHKLVEEELLCVRDALYYLRRSSGSKGPAITTLMRYIMRREVIPRLANKARLATRISLLLAEELASWLNEQGWAKEALPHLVRIDELTKNPKHCLLNPGERSRLLRQLAFSQIMCGKASARIKETLRRAEKATDHPQNRHGVYNARVMLALRDRLPVKAWHTLEEQLSELGVADPWDIDYAHPERSGVRSPTLLAPLGYMPIVALHDSPKGTPNQHELAEHLVKIETELGQRVALLWDDDTFRRTLAAGAEEAFLYGHTMVKCGAEDAALLKEALGYLSV